MQSITERLSNKPDAVQQASTPQLRVQNDSHKRVRPICVRCCLYMYQVPCLTCSTHGAQPQTLACSLLALSSRAARSHAGRHHAALTRARVSAGRVALDAASVQLGHADLGQIGADGNSSCSSRITMATEELYDCRPVMRGST